MEILFKPKIRTLGVAEIQTDFIDMAEPEQVNPLELIIKQAMSGQPVNGFPPSYTEGDLSDIDSMDKVERLQYREDLKLQIEELKHEFHKVTKAEAKLKEELQKAPKEDKSESNEQTEEGQ